MTNFEIFLIVAMCSVPVVALFFVVPKLKKKQKKEKVVEKKVVEEVKKEETPKISEEPKQKAVRPIENSFTSEDFKGYLNKRQNETTKPKRVELPEDFIDRTEDFFPRRRRRIAEKPKTVAEEIRNLSPELKALIISGVLDKKDFDNI